MCFFTVEGVKKSEGKKGPGKQREVVCAVSASRKRNSLRTLSLLLSILLSPVGPGLVLDYARDKDKHEDIETLSRKNYNEN